MLIKYKWLILFCLFGGCFSHAFSGIDDEAYALASAPLGEFYEKLGNLQENYSKDRQQLKQIIIKAISVRESIIKGNYEGQPNANISELLKNDSINQALTTVLKGLRGPLNIPGAGGQSIFHTTISSRAANSVAEMIEGALRNADRKVVVPTTDAILDCIIKCWRKATSVLFHCSNDAFTQLELERWAKIIVGDLSGFGALIKGRESFDSRSKDANSRAFDSDVDPVANQDQLFNEQTIKHYAEQCQYYAAEIDRRKEYYKSKGDREVVFIAEQIRNWLLEFRTIILSIKSIKDVAAKFGSNITVIAQMQANITKLFEELIHAAIPSSYSSNTKSTISAGMQQRPSYPAPYNSYGDLEN